ncbi:transcription termination/antitermination protein NusG [Clostridia bacterium]|nr:transcription termination/antitermination protein NusG [Clostridia bacterium]
MSEEAKWYVIHTYSGYENKVLTNIEKIVENRKMEHLIKALKVPMETVVEHEGGKKKTSIKHVFPSYVFVKMIMCDESWHIIRNTRGVTSFVGPGSKPVPLTDDEVSQFEIDTIINTVNFEVGDSVKVAEGALNGTIAQVVEISDDKRKVKLLISMFGRDSVIEMDSSEVETIEAN